MMYVTSLFIENNTTQIVIKNPTWEQIKNAILALNGLNRNTVMMEKAYEEKGQEDNIKEFMSISGGGENQLYVCTIYSDKDDELVLYEPAKLLKDKTEIVRIFSIFFPSAQCFNLDTILVAAEAYSCFGQKDKSLHWGYISFNELSQIKITEEEAT